MIYSNRLHKTLFSQTSIAPLAMFRVLFGTLMLFSTLRFWSNGWIETQYIAPGFFFKYYGFHWVVCPPDWAVYVLFGLMAISSAGIALGLFYRFFAALFFLSFTYVELIDVSNYLNHYYFVSLIALLLVFLPAHRNYSLDARFAFTKPQATVAAFTIQIIKLQLSIVYFYAGVAKLNYDWLVHALPLKMWLPAQAHLPVMGDWLTYEWVAYAFSWAGAAYDLSIPFLLWNKRTRPYAFFAVIAFHLTTWWLFPIGVFPWVMIFSTLIFFSPHWHQSAFTFLGIPLSRDFAGNKQHTPSLSRLLPLALSAFIAFQLLFPWRYLLYPGKLFWTEQGYRFSWRVMLMEKAGYAVFKVTDPRTGTYTEVDPEEYLSVNQVKQMATQPDLILQFAHFLKKEYERKGIADAEVRANVYVTLNGRPNKLFIDPTLDLCTVKDGLAPKNWILPDA